MAFSCCKTRKGSSLGDALYDSGNQPAGGTALRLTGFDSLRKCARLPRKGESDLYGHRLTSLRRQLGEKLFDWKSLRLLSRVILVQT